MLTFLGITFAFMGGIIVGATWKWALFDWLDSRMDDPIPLTIQDRIEFLEDVVLRRAITHSR